MTSEVYKDKRGEWRWRIVASNKRIVADSGEGYKRKYDCVRALRRLRVAMARDGV